MDCVYSELPGIPLSCLPPLSSRTPFREGISILFVNPYLLHIYGEFDH